MITLHHMPRSRSVRAVWLLEELGAPYEIVPEGFDGVSDALAELNPARTVPVLIDGDEVLYESVTMLEYIAARYGPTPLALPADHPGYWDYRQLLTFGEATLAGQLNALMATVFKAPDGERENWTTDYIRQTYVKRLGVVSRRLAAGPYMMGEAFTIADISIAYSMTLGMKIRQFGLMDLYGDDHRAYYERLAERPAFQRAIKIK